MLNMEIVRDINALCEFKKNLCEITQSLIKEQCKISLYFNDIYDKFGHKPSSFTKEDYDQYEKEVEYSTKMNKQLNTMLDSIDKEIESNITKFLRGI